MKRMTVWLVMALLCLPLAAHAASYEIAAYDMDISIAADGAGHVRETLTYQFDGSYNGILGVIGHEGGLGLGEVRITVDGDTVLEQVGALDGVPYTYTLRTEGERTHYQAFAPGGEGARVFTIEYRLGGMAQRYLDTARVNHVLLDSESAYQVATLRIALPGTQDEAISPFVHGAMDASQMTLQGGVITLGPAKLPAEAKLEVDILFPEAWLAEARPVQMNMLEEALAQEAAIAEAAAAQAAERQRQAEATQLLVTILLGVYAVAALVLFFVYRGRYGLRRHLVPRTDEALLDAITAAEAQAMKLGGVDAGGFTATLLELTDGGTLTMEADGEDTVFAITGKADGHVPHHRQLLDWLFASQASLRISALDADDDYEAAKAFTEGYNAWKAKVREGLVARGWVQDNGAARMAGILGVPVAGLALSFFLLRQGLWPLAIGGVVLSLLLGVLFSRVRKLSDEGEAHMAALVGFEENYADLLASDPGAVVRRAPLVMALGHMQPLADWIDTRPSGDVGYMPYWAYAGWHHQAVRMNETVREAQSHNAGTQQAGDGGSTSSGGGFSGGTGGGNSHGAW